MDLSVAIISYKILTKSAAKVAIEIKSATEIKPRHQTGLKRFLEEHPQSRPIIVSLDKLSRKSGNIEILYIMDFLKMLWNGDII